jgi:hypothetical protein
MPWITLLSAPSKKDAPHKLYDICTEYVCSYVDNTMINFNQCKLMGDLKELPFNAALFSKASLMMCILNIMPYEEYIWTLDADISF